MNTCPCKGDLGDQTPKKKITAEELLEGTEGVFDKLIKKAKKANKAVKILLKEVDKFNKD